MHSMAALGGICLQLRVIALALGSLLHSTNVQGCIMAWTEPSISCCLQELPDLSIHIVICIEELQLHESVLQDEDVLRVFVMYNFLPGFCQSAQQQCTAPLSKLQSPLAFDHVTVSSPYIL